MTTIERYVSFETGSGGGSRVMVARGEFWRQIGGVAWDRGRLCFKPLAGESIYEHEMREIVTVMQAIQMSRSQEALIEHLEAKGAKHGGN